MTRTDAPDMTQVELDRDGKMRYILVDWLIEVADLKLYTRDTLYMAVSLVDRFLERSPITRKTLQLLGIACMVVAARFLEMEVITIREAAWLTDNTYLYEQVVRTMGQAICNTKGHLDTPTHLHFVRLFIELAKTGEEASELMHFVSDKALLHIPSGRFPPAKVAAAVFYITELGRGMQDCWPSVLQGWTGLCLADFDEIVVWIHEVCFTRSKIKDHRGVELHAVNERYERRTGKSASDFCMPSVGVLHQHLLQALNEEADMVLDELDEHDNDLADLARAMDCDQAGYFDHHHYPGLLQPQAAYSYAAEDGSHKDQVLGTITNTAGRAPRPRSGTSFPYNRRVSRLKAVSAQNRLREGDTPINLPSTLVGLRLDIENP